MLCGLSMQLTLCSINPPEMRTHQLLLVSSVGLGINLFGMWATGGHHHHGHSHGHDHGHGHVHNHAHGHSHPGHSHTDHAHAHVHAKKVSRHAISGEYHELTFKEDHMHDHSQHDHSHSSSHSHMSGHECHDHPSPQHATGHSRKSVRRLPLNRMPNHLN